MISFTAENKAVTIFPGSEPDRPVIYLNTFGDEGEQVFQELQAHGCPDFNLAVIGNLEWNHDMVPWDIPSISEKDAAFTGGADEYLNFLIGRIIPEAEREIKGKPVWRGLAGYSLAGLFAVYAVCRTELCPRAASMSGSLWFPGIKDYILSHGEEVKAEHIYFSLGDRENRTRNRTMKCVRENTEEIETFLKSRGKDTVFQLNPGGHFNNTVKRSAAGIRWLLGRP